MYKDTAMKSINADMTDTMIDMEMARMIPGVMSGQMVDTKINGHPITQIFTKIIIKIISTYTVMYMEATETTQTIIRIPG